MAYNWTEKGDPFGPTTGSWLVDTSDTKVSVEIADCGCCGPLHVLEVSSVEEFDAEWKRIGKMLRTHVRRAVKRK